MDGRIGKDAKVKALVVAALEDRLTDKQAVVLRKNSQSNRSEKDAATQAVLTSVCRTLRSPSAAPPDNRYAAPTA